ncbi:MAG: fibronectin type III domain-containing protein, partial [Sedimentisphaerales bacterium]|nr:fibronectin type III domain-containing protein [Sedimentisphaerales bacterium]
CQKTGNYSIPTAFQAPAMSNHYNFETGNSVSPGLNYELVVASQSVQGGVLLTVIVMAGEYERVRFEGTVAKAGWGFSPDDHRFVIHCIDLNGKYHIRLYDLQWYGDDNETEFFDGFISESALGFSPSGRYFAAAVETDPGLYIKVVDVRYPDDNVFVDSQATSVSSAGWGFSPKNLDDNDAAFFYSKKTGQTIWASIVNLTTMNAYPVGVTSNMWWGFSPCGDLFATLDATSQTVLLYSTASGQVVATGGWTGVVSNLVPRCDTNFHYIGDEAITENTAADECSGDPGGDEEEPQWPDGAELTAASVYSNKIKLTWPSATDNVALTGYHVYMDGDIIAEPAPGETTLWVYELSPLTEYSFRIKAGDEEGNWSEPLSLTVSTIENAPTWPDDCNLAADNIEETSLHLEWTSAEDDVAVTGYRIYNYSMYTGSVLVDEVSSNTYHYHVTGLEPWTDYQLSIEAGDSSDNWTRGPRVSVKTPDNHPPTWPASKSLVSQRTGTTEITLGWTEADDNVGISNYIIYGEREGQWVVVGSEYDSYTVSCLSPATEYHFKVEAQDFAGNESTDGPEAYITTENGDADCSGIMDLVSVSSDGSQTVGVASDDGWDPHTSKDVSISRDGRYIAFVSTAVNLVPDDHNTLIHKSSGWYWGYDVFVHDRQTKVTERVSVSSDGSEAELGSSNQMPTISADGRFVVFDSAAANLALDDTKSYRDIFIHDRQNKTTRLVSSSTSGQAGNKHSGGWRLETAISADNRYVAFITDATNFDATDTNGDRDVYIKDLHTGVCTRVSISSDGQQGTQDCWGVDMSDNGQLVVFATASTLVADDTNGKADVYLHDRENGFTTRVSISSEGTQGNGDCCCDGETPRISGNGRYVVFDSSSSNLVENDENDERDIFIHDRLTGETRLVSHSNSGRQADKKCIRPDINGNGRFVVYQSSSTTLTGYFLSEYISDVYIWDSVFDTVSKLSRCPCGNQGRDSSFRPRINHDGSVIAFDSYASNLLPDFGDNNADGDAFVTEFEMVGIADVETTLSYIPVPARLDARMLCMLDVQNIGTAPAEIIETIVTLPQTIAINRIVGSDFDEDSVIGNEITLAHSSISEGSSVFATFEFIPQTAGPSSILAVSTCDNIESDLINNTHQLSYNVTEDLTTTEFDGCPGINQGDFSVFAFDWLNDSTPYADVSGPDGIPDNIVDLYDLYIFAENWLSD